MSSSDEPTPSDVPESPASFGVRAFGHRRRAVECTPGHPVRIINSVWSNMPMTFTVEVEPKEVGGTWVERRSGRPFGIGLNEAASGPITASMKFHRSWWDGSYQVVFTTDRPASTTTRRTGIRAPRPTTAPRKTIRELVRKGSTLLTDE